MSDKIEIHSTVDGQPAGTTASLLGKMQNRTRKPSMAMRSDPYIWGIYIFLLMISVIELFSASSTEVVANNVYAPLVRHGIFLAAGLLLVLSLQKVHYKYFSHYAMPVAILSLGLLVLSTMIGVEINGAQRAINIAGFTIQPAEIVKLTVILWLATILGKNQQPGGVSTRGVVYAAVVVLVFSALLWKNGLTNTLMLMLVSIAMFMIGGVPLKKLLIVLACYGIGAGCLYMAKYATDSRNDAAKEFEQLSTVQAPSHSDKPDDRSGTHVSRIKRYIAGVHPEDEIDDYNRQVILSHFAQAHGGTFGQGPGNSRESARLPLAFSDYIYSIVIEDTGLCGGIILITVYLWLLARAGQIAYGCSRAFPAFLILGCAVLIVLQALSHMAIATGLGPVSGQPLPLISKGGTSILVMSAAIGIMLSVSRHAVTNRNKKHEDRELSELPPELQAANMASADKQGA